MDKTYFDRLRGRRTEVEKTLRHVENERRTVESNREWAGAAYESRIDLLDCLTDWYREETARIDDALKWDDQVRYGLCLACHETYRSRTYAVLRRDRALFRLSTRSREARDRLSPPIG